MPSLRPVPTAEPTLLDPLCDLLIDAVHGGASVGFLAPLSRDRAARYWTQVFAGLDQGLRLWVAEAEGRVVGSVQLALNPRENGLHRAEVQKLLVLGTCQGRGLAGRLMAEVEAAARAEGRTLLVLDTLAGTRSEAIYQHLGWQRVGEIPAFAATPDGQLHPTVVFYKRLDP